MTGAGVAWEWGVAYECLTRKREKANGGPQPGRNET
jgi:hypothetical protein